jgi:hypothetical protein
LENSFAWYISSLDIHWIEFSIDFWRLVKNSKNAGGECVKGLTGGAICTDFMSHFSIHRNWPHYGLNGRSCWSRSFSKYTSSIYWQYLCQRMAPGSEVGNQPKNYKKTTRTCPGLSKWNGISPK